MSTHEKKTESGEDLTTQDRHTTDEPVETAPEPQPEESEGGTSTGTSTEDRHTTDEPAK